VIKYTESLEPAYTQILTNRGRIPPRMTFEKKQQGEEYWKKMAKNIEERNEVESTFGTNTTISSELNSLIQMKREQVHVIFQRM
jgi:hypothetical protein